MTDEEQRWRCVELAGGNLTRALEILAFVKNDIADVPVARIATRRGVVWFPQMESRLRELFPLYSHWMPIAVALNIEFGARFSPLAVKIKAQKLGLLRGASEGQLRAIVAANAARSTKRLNGSSGRDEIRREPDAGGRC